VISSPFLRCIQTALYFANLLDIDEITIDYRLSEIGSAVDPLRDDGELSIDQIFDQSMQYIEKFCRQSADLEKPFLVIPDYEKEIFKLVLYDSDWNYRIRIIKGEQKINTISYNESKTEYNQRMKNVIEELQSNDTYSSHIPIECYGRILPFPCNIIRCTNTQSLCRRFKQDKSVHHICIE